MTTAFQHSFEHRRMTREATSRDGASAGGSQALDAAGTLGGRFASATPSIAAPVAPIAPVVPVAPVAPTARQLEVLSLVAQGWQNKQIAHELGIAERTVKLHMTTLFHTLEARNRTHLLVRARALGLVVW